MPVSRKKPQSKKPVKATKKAQAPKTKPETKAQPAKRTKDKSIPDVPRGATAEDKSQLLYTYAKENGWWAQLKHEGKDIIRLVCKKDDGRNKDTITSEWIGGRIPQGGLVFVLEDGRVIRLRNLSHALHALNGSWQPKRDVTPRRARAAKPKTSLRVMEDGHVERVEVERTYAPVGAHIVDKWYHLEVTKPLVTGKGRNRKVTTKVALRMGPVMRATADKFVAEAEATGETATLTEHIPGSCEVCRASTGEQPAKATKGKPVKEAAVAKAKPKRKKQVA